MANHSKKHKRDVLSLVRGAFERQIFRPSCIVAGDQCCKHCSSAQLSPLNKNGFTQNEVVTYAKTKGGICLHPTCGRIHCTTLLKATYHTTQTPTCLDGFNSTPNSWYFWRPIDARTKVSIFSSFPPIVPPVTFVFYLNQFEFDFTG
jgi:hypothetical protein